MALPSDLFDVVVVGGGIIGSCTAYHAQKAGLKTLLIEKYSLGHSRGSSAGKSRIIRYAHTEPEYLPLVKESFEQIADMEKQREEKLWTKCGLLWLGKKKEMEDISQILTNFECENEVTRRYPQFHYGPEWAGLVDPMGGIIHAHKWLRAFHDEFQRIGGHTAENWTVFPRPTWRESNNETSLMVGETSGWNRDHSSFTGTTTFVRAKKVVFAVGTWINKLIPGFPVESRNELITVAYWRPKNAADDHLVNPDKYPAVIINTDGIGYYSLPSCDYNGAVKFAYHEGEVYADADANIENMSKKYIDMTRRHLQKHLPLFETENGPWKVDRCKYAVSSIKKLALCY